MILEKSLIECACVQYAGDEEFKAYTDSWLARLRATNPSIPTNSVDCFAIQVNRAGTTLAKYILEGYETSQGKEPHCST